jgi:imidazoleglycerol-phosphate dehydratase
MSRVATCDRKTGETEIRCRLELDGRGETKVQTGIPFFDHMLTLWGFHAGFDLELAAHGDIEVDFHHTVEDVGIVLGQCLKEAAKDKSGLRRYASLHLPMDEALVLVAVDWSGRPLLAYEVPLVAQAVGPCPFELVPEFCRALATHAGLTLHVRGMAGDNAHHVAEAVFKGLGRALGEASRVDPRRSGVPSTKGVL